MSVAEVLVSWIALALLTKQSIPPKAWMVFATAAFTWSSKRTSHTQARPRPPAASISRTVSCTVPASLGFGVSVLPSTATFAPSRAARSAMARPMPRLAPVISSVFPDKVAIFPLLPETAGAVSKRGASARSVAEVGGVARALFLDGGRGRRRRSRGRRDGRRGDRHSRARRSAAEGCPPRWLWRLDRLHGSVRAGRNASRKRDWGLLLAERELRLGRRRPHARRRRFDFRFGARACAGRRCGGGAVHHLESRECSAAQDQKRAAEQRCYQRSVAALRELHAGVGPARGRGKSGACRKLRHSGGFRDLSRNTSGHVGDGYAPTAMKRAQRIREFFTRLIAMRDISSHRLADDGFERGV